MQKLFKLTRTMLALSCALLAAGLWCWEAGQATPAAQPLPRLQGEAAREYLQQQGLYASLGEAVRAARHSINPSASALLDSQQAKLTASDAQGRDSFGAAIAISGETIVVGVPNDDDAGGSSGSAYVFVRTGTVWSQQQKLTANDAAVNDRFGWSVGISGETIVVGAPNDDHVGSSSGSAYVFARTGTVWSQQQKLTASDAAGDDWFGYSVAISGETIVVGAYFDDDAGGNSGSAYVFARTGTVWSQQQKLTASDAAGDNNFGNAVAISGETVVVGAVLDDDAGRASGSAYVFVRTGTVWSQQQKLTASDAAAGDVFGAVLAISGETIVIGAQFDADAGSDSGSAYVFVRTGTVWSEQQKLTASDAAAFDLFGYSVRISGETIVIGAPGDDDAGSQSGSAYVFARTGTVWSQQQKLTASDAAAGDRFGASVAVSGEMVVVGATGDDDAGSDSGSAYIFALNRPPLITFGAVTRQQGAAASISQIAAVNDPDQPLDLLAVTVDNDTSATSNGVTISDISVDASGKVTASVAADCAASNATFTLTVTDNQMASTTATLTVNVTVSKPPTLTLKPSIQLWPPNHSYRAVTIADMVASATDDCDGDVLSKVVIVSVTSDEPDDAPGNSDGDTINDIVIAGDCKSVQLRAERDDKKDGRVYNITLRARDSSGSSTTAVFKASVPINPKRAAAGSGVSYKVNSSCP